MVLSMTMKKSDIDRDSLSLFQVMIFEGTGEGVLVGLWGRHTPFLPKIGLVLGYISLLGDVLSAGLVIGPLVL